MPLKYQPAIHAALLDVRKALSGLTPGTKHQQGYKYRSSEQVYQRLTQALVDAGVNMAIEVLERTTDQLPRAQKAPAWRVTLMMRLHFTAISDGSTTWSDTIGESIDYADKCSMQAMTVGVKYGVVHAFSISEAEVDDPDADKTEAPAPPSKTAATTTGDVTTVTTEQADAQMDLARAGGGDEMAAEVKALEEMLLEDADMSPAARDNFIKRAKKLPAGDVLDSLRKGYEEKWGK